MSSNRKKYWWATSAGFGIVLSVLTQPTSSLHPRIILPASGKWHRGKPFASITVITRLLFAVHYTMELVRCYDLLVLAASDCSIVYNVFKKLANKATPFLAMRYFREGLKRIHCNPADS